MEFTALLATIDYRVLPSVNALLNTVAATLLVVGYLQIRKRNIRAHYRTMWSALGVSAVFLATYVTYHALRQMDTGVGHTVFMLEGPVAYVYYSLLLSHILLAFTVVPLALLSIYRGWIGFRRGDAKLINRHRKISKWTLPVWLYVSVTGVLVYLMLYHLPGATG